MKINIEGIELIKEFESLQLKAYRAHPSEKNFTIGYGHYSEAIKEDTVITEAVAQILLESDLEEVDAFVQNEFSELNPNEHSAVVSLVFNIGSGRFMKSNAYDSLKNMDYDIFAFEAFDETMGFVKAGKEVLNGLIRRRASEEALFYKIDKGE